ncbi:MAG: von Willebrand factor type A domain-containing protein [Candidatus Binatia bacterium]
MTKDRLSLPFPFRVAAFAIAASLLGHGCAGRPESGPGMASRRPDPVVERPIAPPPVVVRDATNPDPHEPQYNDLLATDDRDQAVASPPAANPDQLRGLGYMHDGAAVAARKQGEARSEAYAGATSADAIAPQAQMRPRGAAEMHIHGGLGSMGGLPQPASNTERYQHLDDNPLHIVASDPVSTFSLDVDTGSYSNVRRFLAAGNRPPEDAVRVEELVNYFPYDYPKSGGEHPFGVRTELAPCPWKSDHWLMRVAVRADEVGAHAMPPANLVFLVDVSGSMSDANKLPLLRTSLKMLAGQLRSEDRVSLVVYAGREAVVLEPTPGDQHARIESAIDNLESGGSTAGEAGIRLAYRMARNAFVKGGINRVLLATDGDSNVGITDFEQLKDLVERERESGVQFSTLGFGTGVDSLRYGAAEKPAAEAPRASTGEIAFVKLRYKQPAASESRLVEIPVEKSAMLASFDKAGDDFRFATAVAGFGQLLRGGKRTGAWNWDDVLATATSARGKDEFGYRSEFLSLVRMAKVTG